MFVTGKASSRNNVFMKLKIRIQKHLYSIRLSKIKIKVKISVCKIVSHGDLSPKNVFLYAVSVALSRSFVNTFLQKNKKIFNQNRQKIMLLNCQYFTVNCVDISYVICYNSNCKINAN